MHLRSHLPNAFKMMLDDLARGHGVPFWRTSDRHVVMAQHQGDMVKSLRLHELRCPQR